ncbi:MAG TPA: DUF4037 domain-containing protein [Symbiobacteriaceae bacterium]|nr:DUF4037 domain-containing protein [Symbiobacteriaceae bacterium]
MEKQLEQLVEAVARIPGVQAIGHSGGSRPLPVPGEGDIDLFVYCSAIPEEAARHAALSRAPAAGVKTGVLAGGSWGVADAVDLGGVETWLMYFTLDELWDEVETTLRGDRVARVDDYYYPVGRLAMLQGIGVLFDPGGLFTHIKERIAVYPDRLAKANLRFHLPRITDEEDFGRAVSRQDVLFYHFTLDLCLDHFLQALFALNRVFPSRKRSLQYIAGFRTKPADCERRLLRVVALGARAETLSESYAQWRGLSEELTGLADQNYWEQDF